MSVLATTSNLSSVEVCRLTGATYRQLDYWARFGLFGSDGSEMPGAGNHRKMTLPQAIVARVCVLFSRLTNGGKISDLLGEVHDLLVDAYIADPMLTGRWLVVSDSGTRISAEPLRGVEVGFLIDLAECARYIAERVAA